MMYWAQKYCMFNRVKRPNPGTEFLNNAMFQIIYMGPILYSLGSLTWSNFFPEGTPKSALLPNLVALGISCLIFIIPTNLIMSCFFDEEKAVATFYDKERIFFPSEYDRLNPDTYEKGI